MSSKKDLTEELNEKETKVKKRLWTLVVYPESMSEGWVDFLKFRGNDFAFSLHNGYTNGNKEHFHIILWFDNPVGQKTVDEYLQAINPGTNLHSQPVVKPIKMMQYMIHLNNPDKPQYPKGQIYCEGEEALELFETAFDPMKSTKQGRMLAFRALYFKVVHIIADHQFYQWSQLNFYLEDHPEIDPENEILNFLIGNPYMVTQWLTDTYHALTRPYKDLDAKIEEQFEKDYAKTMNQMRKKQK